jgi:hypothetical protein
MDCFADFCLSCDRQTNGTPFCSQACRLAELDHSSPSLPISPSDSYSERAAHRSPQPARSGFYLPPAFDFSSHRTSPLSRSKRPASLSVARRTTNPPTLQNNSSLSPTSSQASLSSIKTTQSHHAKLSQQAEHDLKEYARSFDQVRTLRRRISLGQ